MAIVRLALENPAADTDTLLHTAVRQSVASVIATNKSSTPATIRVWLVPSGATIPAEYSYLAYDTVVPGNNSLETFRTALETDDVVYVRASTADISFSLNAIHESSGNYNKVTIQDTAPGAPTIGDVWVNATQGYVKFWDGSQWVNAVPGSAGYAQTIQPSFPEEGQLWVDLDGVPTTEPDYPTVTYSPTQPTGLDATNTGNIWVNSNNKTVNVWTGTEWTFTSTVATYDTVQPSSPAAGQIWIDSATNFAYIYDGSSWNQVGIDLSSYAPLDSPDFTGNASFDTNTLYVDSVNNKIGIGTTSPQSPLYIKQNGDSALSIEGTNEGVYSFYRKSAGGYLHIDGTQSTGYNGFIFSTTPSGGALTERMRIDNNGYVTMPYQPRFQARCLSGSTGHAQYADIIFDSVGINVSNSYNNTNGRFTAPISGYYYFYKMIRIDLNKTYWHAWWKKNGSALWSSGLAGYGLNGLITTGNTVGFNAGWAELNIYLSAGDYITASPWTAGDINNQSYFGGYLLG